MTLIQAVYGDNPLSRAYDRTFQELQDCLKQHQRLESFKRLTKKQRKDLSDLKIIMPALAWQLAEIHLKMANSLVP